MKRLYRQQTTATANDHLHVHQQGAAAGKTGIFTKFLHQRIALNSNYNHLL